MTSTRSLSSLAIVLLAGALYSACGKHDHFVAHDQLVFRLPVQQEPD